MKKISENLSGDFLTHTVCIATLQVGNANATRTIGAYSSARKSASGWTLSLHEETTLLLMILWSQLLVCKNTITLQWQETIAVQCINACLVLPTHATQLYSHPWGSEHPNIFLWFVRLPWLIAVFRLHNYECVAPLVANSLHSGHFCVRSSASVLKVRDSCGSRCRSAPSSSVVAPAYYVSSRPKNLLTEDDESQSLFNVIRCHPCVK